MKIKKTYHFYAAHRNQFLEGKCERLHGHVYRLACIFDVQRAGGRSAGGVMSPKGAVTRTFEDFDSKIEPMLKNYFDHRTLWDVLSGEPSTTEPSQIPVAWMTPFPFPTSVENVSLMLFYLIRESLSLPIVELQLQETESSTVIYTDVDYDRELLQFRRAAEWMSTHAFWKPLFN